MWRPLLRVFLVPFKFVFGYDVFISYARLDGSSYAEALCNELSSSAAPRIDLQETRPNQRLPLLLKAAIALSKVLVVVGTPAAAKSEHVSEEVATFTALSDGPVVLIQLSHPVGDTNWRAGVPGVPYIVEADTSASSANQPSLLVIRRILGSVGFWKRSRRLSAAALCGLAITSVLGTSVYTASASRKATRAAALATAAEALLQQPATDTSAPLIAALAATGWRMGKTSDAWNALQTVPAAVLADTISRPDDEYGTFLAFASSPAGFGLITRSTENTVSVSKLGTGNTPLYLLNHEKVQNAVLSPKQDLLATFGTDRTVRLWRFQDGHLVQRLALTDPVQQLAFSEDGGTLLTLTNPGLLQTWIPGQDTAIHRLTTKAELAALAIANEGSYIAFADSSGNLTVLQTDNGRPVLSVKGTAPVAVKDFVHLAFSPDGTQLTLAQESGAALYRIADGSKLATVSYDHDALRGVAISPDGALVCAVLGVGGEYTNLDVRIISLLDQSELRLQNYDTGFSKVQFGSDGRSIALGLYSQSGAGSEGSTDIWKFDLSQREESHFRLAQPATLAIDTNSRQLAIAHNDPEPDLIDPLSRKLSRLSGSAPVRKVVFDQDDTFVAMLTTDGRVYLSRAGVSPFRLVSQAKVSDLVFAGANYLHTLSEDGELITINANSGAIESKYSVPDYAKPAAFSVNGEWLLWVALGHGRVLQISSRRISPTFTWAGYEEEYNDPTAVAISADGQIAAIGQGDDATLLLKVPAPTKDKKTVKDLEWVRIPDNGATAVAFSPTGAMFATGSKNGIIHLINCAEGREFARIRQGPAIFSLALSDSGWFAASDNLGNVRVWSTDPGHMLDQLCASPGRNLTEEEWKRTPYLADLPWRATCTSWPVSPR